MSNKDYAVVDISDNNKKIMLAVGDYYQVYYYKFSSTKKSKEFIKNEINGLKSKNNIIKKEKSNSYEKYLISNKNVYTIYSRIDDTCISVSTVKTYSNNVDQLFDYLGYQWFYFKKSFKYDIMWSWGCNGFDRNIEAQMAGRMSTLQTTKNKRK